MGTQSGTSLELVQSPPEHEQYLPFQRHPRGFVIRLSYPLQRRRSNTNDAWRRFQIEDRWRATVSFAVGVYFVYPFFSREMYSRARSEPELMRIYAQQEFGARQSSLTSLRGDLRSPLRCLAPPC